MSASTSAVTKLKAGDVLIAWAGPHHTEPLTLTNVEEHLVKYRRMLQETTALIASLEAAKVALLALGVSR